MKVRAIAAASRDTTAVGSVELECTPGGLVMVYQGVGAYSEGYAPAAVTTNTRCLAPWPDVLDVRIQDECIWLSVTPSLTPHHVLCLTNFTQGQKDPREQRKRRRMVRGGSALLALAVGFSLSASIPAWSPRSGQLTGLGLGVTAALFVLSIALLAEKFWLAEESNSTALRETFLAELQHYRPGPIRSGARTRPEERLQLAELLHLLPRSTTAIVIVLTASSLAAVLTSSWILGRGSSTERPIAYNEPPRPAAVPPPPPLPAAAVPAPAKPNPAVTAPEDPPKEEPAVDSAQSRSGVCQCERADSVLWRHPFLRLSTLLISQRLRSHKQHHHVELELAVVNNGNQPLKELSLLVQFFEDDGKTHTKDRPLYYESWLNPGQAIKWHVEARGTSFLVQNAVRDELTPEELANANQFADLLNANHRPVRLHGAMALAYLKDDRAKAGALKLQEALREEEAPYLERVLAAERATFACDVRAEKKPHTARIEACIFNGGAEPRDDLGLQVRALDRVFDPRNPVAPPPLVVSEKAYRFPGEIPAGEGRWAAVTLGTSNAGGRTAESFEVFVDAFHRLY